MATTRRTYRVAEMLREQMATKLLQLSDPRFYLVSITGSVISPDLRDAKIYWSVSGDDQRKLEVKKAFEAARGYLQASISKDLKLKCSPRIVFFYDNTLDVVDHVEVLLKKVNPSQAQEDSLETEQINQVELDEGAEHEEK